MIPELSWLLWRNVIVAIATVQGKVRFHPWAGVSVSNFKITVMEIKVREIHFVNFFYLIKLWSFDIQILVNSKLKIMNSNANPLILNIALISSLDNFFSDFNMIMPRKNSRFALQNFLEFFQKKYSNKKIYFLLIPTFIRLASLFD